MEEFSLQNAIRKALVPEEISQTDDQQIERLLASHEDAPLGDESVKRILDTFAKLDELSDTKETDTPEDENNDTTGATPSEVESPCFPEIAIDTTPLFNDPPPSLWPRAFLPLLIGITTVSLVIGTLGFISLQKFWKSQGTGKNIAVNSFCSTDCRWKRSEPK